MPQIWSCEIVIEMRNYFLRVCVVWEEFGRSSNQRPNKDNNSKILINHGTQTHEISIGICWDWSVLNLLESRSFVRF